MATARSLTACALEGVASIACHRPFRQRSECGRVERATSGAASGSRSGSGSSVIGRRDGQRIKEVPDRRPRRSRNADLAEGQVDECRGCGHVAGGNLPISGEERPGSRRGAALDEREPLEPVRQRSDRCGRLGHRGEVRDRVEAAARSAGMTGRTEFASATPARGTTTIATTSRTAGMTGRGTCIGGGQPTAPTDERSPPQSWNDLCGEPLDLGRAEVGRPVDEAVDAHLGRQRRQHLDQLRDVFRARAADVDDAPDRARVSIGSSRGLIDLLHDPWELSSAGYASTSDPAISLAADQAERSRGHRADPDLDAMGRRRTGRVVAGRGSRARCF